MEKICPVCGYKKLADYPYDNYGYPTYVICSCCGYEFGFDDSSNGMTFKAYRKKWIADGFQFFRKDEKPSLWNFDVLEKQLKNVLKVNYKPRL